MKRFFSFFILLSLFSPCWCADYEEYVHQKNVPIVIKQVVNGFFGSQNYTEKEACLRGVLTEAEKCQTYYGYPRNCLKEKALERILGNIKTKSMELARQYALYHPQKEDIITVVGRKVYNQLKDIIGYDYTNYTGAFEKFVTYYPLPAYSFEDKIRRMVEEEKNQYNTQKFHVV